jgi:two-component system phosphate regulon sensor histidine kinase PhoR
MIVFFNELLIFAILLVVALSLNKTVALIVCLSYLVWHFYFLMRLLFWFRHKNSFTIPKSIGIWKFIFIHLHQQRKSVSQLNERLHSLEHVRQDFVANVSHELRTPLTVLRGYLETLTEVPGSQTEGQHLPMINIHQQMLMQTKRMSQLVDDLLLLSRLESVEPNVAEQEWVELLPLMLSIRADALVVSGDDGHQIMVDVKPGLKLRGNRAELRSAFSNLVVNAVRYTPVKGRITIRAYEDPSGVHVAVVDTGIGIAKEDIPRLTERFYRVDAARSRHVGGTGLGLAIVKHVLLRHHSQLVIESVFGQGSTFRCDFPIS